MSRLSNWLNGGKQKEPHTPIESPNTLQSKQIIRIIDLLGEGELGEGTIGPLVNGYKSVFFDNTVFQNDDDTFNFKGVELATTLGTLTQGVLPGFANVEGEVAVGVEVEFGDPITRTITNLSATAVRVTIEIPNLSHQNASNGDLNPTTVSIHIDVREDGGSYLRAVTDTITGKTVSPYQKSYRFNLPGEGPWDIRVTRPTADSTVAALQNITNWASYTEIEDFQLNYPYSSIVGVAIDAQQFGGNIPQRNYEVYGLKIQVPSNYDPETRVYTGIWDGTFQTAWSDNPAWVFYDLLTNLRYGLGQFIDASQIDKFGLYAIAQYCDEEVPDGQGGEEPRYIFNGVVSSSDDAMRVLITLAGAFRGMVYWGPSGVAVTSDQPSDPVRVLAPANVLDGTFNYSGTSLKVRHTFALVSWTNPDNNYEQDIEPVDGDPEEIAKWGWRPTEVVAFGCTSRSQAHRFGRWILDSERTQTETVSWVASFDQADILPGEIVTIADPAYSGVDFGGRLAAVAVDGLSITVDRPITIETLLTYTVSVILADGTVADRTLTNSAGEATVFTFTSALSPLPLVNGMWVLASSTLSQRQFRVISRTEDDTNLFAFTALFHDPDKYLRVEENITLVPPNYSTLPTGAILPPSDLAAEEYPVTSTGVARNLVVLSWTASPDARVKTYEVQVRQPDQTNWIPASPVTQTSDVSIDLYDIAAGVWGFRVRSIDIFGLVSPWVVLDPITLEGLYYAPDSVVDFYSLYTANVTQFSWTEITDARVPIVYEIRKGLSWESGTVLGRYAHPPVPALGDDVYWINSVVIPGRVVYGDDPIALSVVNSVIPLNVKASFDQLATGWIGTLTGDIYNDGTFVRTTGPGIDLLSSPDVISIVDWLYSGVPQGDGIYTIPASHQIDVGYVSPCLVAITFSSAGVFVSNDFFTYDPLFDVEDFFGSEANQNVDVHPEIRLSQDGTTWGNWQNYQAGVYQARKFDARMIVNSLEDYTVAYVTSFVFAVTVPTRVDNWAIISGARTSLNRVSVPAAGITLTFLPDTQTTAGPFNGGISNSAQPGVLVTVLNWQAGDIPKITSLTTTGCVVQIMNAGIGVAREANIRPEGY